MRHKGAWIELRPNDLKNAERFCAANPDLSLDDALRLTASEGDTLMRLPACFDAGPRLQGVLEQYHQQKHRIHFLRPRASAVSFAPTRTRPGWLAFLHRFDQGACLADDMGLGKTIQLLAFLQHLKNGTRTETAGAAGGSHLRAHQLETEAAAFTPSSQCMSTTAPTTLHPSSTEKSPERR